MSAVNNTIHLNTTLKLYDRAYSRGWWAKIRSVFGCRRPRLFDLETLAQGWTIRGRRFTGRETVALEQIRGTENRAADFDGCFNPCAKHTEERWRSVASAWLRGIELPPVDLIRVDEVYFVRDGHHRISVAAALGQCEIDAVVTVWEVDGAHPWAEEVARPQPANEVVVPAEPIWSLVDGNRAIGEAG